MRPLRTADDRRQFCDAYFAAVGAHCMYEADQYREYTLPRDVDKALTDRPFYWMWVETTQQDVAPTIARMAYATDAVSRENKRLYQLALDEQNPDLQSPQGRMFFRPPQVELVTLGSFRLDKILNHVLTLGRCAAVCPAFTQSDTKLVPWLMMNARITYRCDVTEERLVSMGRCLNNGQIVDQFFTKIFHIDMRPLHSGDIIFPDKQQITDTLNGLAAHIKRVETTRDCQWATDAQERLEKDLQQLQTYYHSLTLCAASDDERIRFEDDCRRKQADLRQRTTPRIEVDVMQLALVALPERMATSTIQ